MVVVFMGCTRIVGSDYPMDTKFMTVSCPFVASIKERLASPRPWFKVLVYVAAKLVRIATALLKYGEKFSFEKAGISKAVLKQWELEQAKAA